MISLKCSQVIKLYILVDGPTIIMISSTICIWPDNNRIYVFSKVMPTKQMNIFKTMESLLATMCIHKTNPITLVWFFRSQFFPILSPQILRQTFTGNLISLTLNDCWLCILVHLTKESHLPQRLHHKHNDNIGYWYSGTDTLDTIQLLWVPNNWLRQIYLRKTGSILV